MRIAFLYRRINDEMKQERYSPVVFFLDVVTPKASLKIFFCVARLMCILFGRKQPIFSCVGIVQIPLENPAILPHPLPLH